MTCDTFPAYSFSSGKFTDALFKIYTFLFGWFIFSIPKKIQIYGNSMVKFAIKAGVKKKKIVILPTGINLKKFQSWKNIRKELGISDKEFVLVYAGLIVPRKGIDIMLRTFKKLNNENVKLLLVGDGPNKKKYISMAYKLGIQNKVKFLGWRKDIPSILRSSDALFLPSRGEGLPGIVMEAMASGLPVVASNIPCIPDLVEDGKNGVLCKKDDVDYFAYGINNMISDKSLVKMAEASKLKIKNFGWDLLLPKYRKLYYAN
jgi:glycosyltransferase EpsD